MFFASGHDYGYCSYCKQQLWLLCHQPRPLARLSHDTDLWTQSFVISSRPKHNIIVKHPAIKNTHNGPALQWLKMSHESAGKATKECSEDALPGSAGSLGAMKAGRGMASQALWLLFFCLFNSFTLFTSISFSLFWLFYTILFLMFSVTVMQGGLYLSKGTGKATAIFWGCLWAYIPQISQLITVIALLLQFLFFATSLYANFILLLRIYGHNILLWTEKKRKREKQLQCLKSEDFFTCELTLKKSVIAWTCSSHENISSIRGLLVKMIVKISCCGLPF